MDSFDFNEWAELYKNDPEAFEIKRLEWIETAIDHANPERQLRLRGLQFEIDSKRRTAHSVLQAYFAMSQRMWQSVSILRDVLEGQLPPKIPVYKNSRVLPFEKIDR